MAAFTDKEKIIQEDLYVFPYHHLTSCDNGNFQQHKQDRWGYEYLSFLRFALKILAEENWLSLLDVGCGDGKLLHELKKIMPVKQLAGIDISAQAIAFARAFNPEINFIVGDIETQNGLTIKYDLITLIETLEHISPDQLKKFLLGLHDNLATNGRLLLTVPSANTAKNPKHYQHFTLLLLKSCLAPYFEIQKYYYLNKISLGVRMIERLLDNRIFLLNHRPAQNFLFKMYEKCFLMAGGKNSKRIIVIASKLKLAD
jgi:SAM-dependent methyltransferase